MSVEFREITTDGSSHRARLREFEVMAIVDIAVFADGERLFSLSPEMAGKLGHQLIDAAAAQPSTPRGPDAQDRRRPVCETA